MTTPAFPARPAGQPSLDELMTRFLAARTAAGDAPPDASEVEPHEVTGGFRTPAAVAWDEAKAVFRLFGVEPEKLAPPAEWSAFVALDSADAAVPLAAGVYPQRVRRLAGTDRPAADRVDGFSGLRNWVRKTLKTTSPTALLTAAGVAALLGDRAEAEAALAAAEPVCRGRWRAVWENQRAAVRWLAGDRAAAAATWAAADPDTPVLFNRGLSAPAGLEAAAEALPDTSGWSHLARLWLAKGRI